MAYGWDAAGNRTSLRKRDGAVIAFHYDGLDRVAQKTVPASASGAPGYTVVTRHDVRDLPLSAGFGSVGGIGVVTAYDGFGRPVATTDTMAGTGRTLAYEYDSGGRRRRLHYPDGIFFSYEYDPGGALTAIRDQSGTLVATFAYDAAGRPAWKGLAGALESYGYDGVSRLAGLTHDLAGTASDHALTFAYNPASQIVKRVRSNDAYAASAPTALSRSYGVNGLNQYTQTAVDGAPV